MLEIYTTQISQWREVKRLEIELIDITAKTGNKSFSPDFNIVMQYKKGDIDEKTYTDLYTERMRYSYLNTRDDWFKLTHGSRIALGCYCKPNTFCHRYLFKDMLIKFCNKFKIPNEYFGEVMK